MNDIKRYQSISTGERIEASVVAEGRIEMYTNMEGFKDRALSGQYLIVHPYHEAVDPESFEREYEILEPRETKV